MIKHISKTLNFNALVSKRRANRRTIVEPSQIMLGSLIFKGLPLWESFSEFLDLWDILREVDL